jgi:hypothetical protein
MNNLLYVDTFQHVFHLNENNDIEQQREAKTEEGRVDGRTNRQTERNGHTYRRKTGGQMKRWMVGWTDGQTNRQTDR